MTLIRVALVVVQALCNGLACTPPNPTPKNRRYHTQEMYILQIAPLIFKCHQIICYLCALFEVLHYARSTLPFPSPVPSLTSLTCPSFPPTSPPPSLPLTPSFLLGILAVLLGTYIRLDCFRTLGELFTFDLTIHPSHRLITHRFYAYVRHPAYTGSLLLVFGLAFSHLTRGSWLVECGPLSGRWGLVGGAAGMVEKMGAVRVAVWAVWWVWTLCVGVSRADAEDRQMRALFKEEWEVWAREVPWWFFPGVI